MEVEWFRVVRLSRPPHPEVQSQRAEAGAHGHGSRPAACDASFCRCSGLSGAQALPTTDHFVLGMWNHQVCGVPPWSAVLSASVRFCVSHRHEWLTPWRDTVWTVCDRNAENTRQAGVFWSVELEGFEPSTSCMPCKRSAELSYSPMPIGGPDVIRPRRPPIQPRCSGRRPRGARVRNSRESSGRTRARQSRRSRAAPSDRGLRPRVAAGGAPFRS